MKVKITLFTLLLLSVLLVGCRNNNNNTKGGNQNTTPSTAPTATPGVTTTAVVSPTTTPPTDVVTTASIVNTEDAFLNAISSKGTWIIAITKDLTVNKDIVLDGEFKNGKKDDAGKDIIQRKLALYSQDENRNITARYTLTAPKFTIKSPMASIQHGTFKGDLYVDVADFQLIDATVDGNVYFTSQEYQNSFQMDDTSKITGTQTLQTK
jgi:hypothetical protein